MNESIEVSKLVQRRKVRYNNMVLMKSDEYGDIWTSLADEQVFFRVEEATGALFLSVKNNKYLLLPLSAPKKLEQSRQL